MHAEMRAVALLCLRQYGTYFALGLSVAYAGDGEAIMPPCVTAARHGGIAPLHSHDRLVFCLSCKPLMQLRCPQEFWLLLVTKVTALLAFHEIYYYYKHTKKPHYCGFLFLLYCIYYAFATASLMDGTVDSFAWVSTFAAPLGPR